MRARSTAAVRMVGLALLLLVLSPVTAPFATCDFAWLLGTGSDGGAAILHDKTAADKLTTDVRAAFLTVAAKPIVPMDRCATHAGDQPVQTPPIPLRI